ncbi:PfkB family carbohydrate kinase [Lysinibacter cavernae]|uniref:Ribokinase n=1 Tax=Lysinibacter cavernae TaxID=1640652 RepID=A0A7X5R2U9_9MICO|nr:ribokinase [Lysinibacter cavernae]
MQTSDPSRILVVGSLNADLVVRTERFPKAGETLHGSELSIIPGGKGANQAVAAGRLGARVSMVGAVGADSNGELLLDSLVAAGVDLEHVDRLESVATGTAVITVDAAGENTIIVSAGANGKLGQDDVAGAFDSLSDVGVLCLCLEVGIDTVLAAARRAHSAGAQVLCNLSPYGPVPDELLQLTDVLLLNEHEAAHLAGVSSASGDWDAVAASLRAKGIDRAVITMGAAGAVVIDGASAIETVPSPRVTAVDTTGCGDAFMGSLALRLAEGASLAEAAAFAATVGSYAATGYGAQASYPDRKQLAEFVAG